MDKQLYVLMLIPDQPELEINALSSLSDHWDRPTIEFRQLTRSKAEFLVALEQFSWQIQLQVNRERAKLREEATVVAENRLP